MNPARFDTLAPFPIDAWRRIRSQFDPEKTASAAAHMERGAALHSAGMPEWALTEFEAALALDPADANAASACAAVLVEAGRPRAANALLQSRRALLERTPEGACNLGWVAGVAGDTAAARMHFEQALALDADSRRAHDGASRLAAGEQDWARALPHAVRCVDLAPRDRAAYLHLADLFLAARQPLDALRVLGQARQTLGEHASVAIRVIVVLAAAGDAAQAQAMLARLPDGGRPAIEAELDGLARLGIDAVTARAADMAVWGIAYATAGTLEGHAPSREALARSLEQMLAGQRSAPPAAWTRVRPALAGLPVTETVTNAAILRADAQDLQARAPADRGFPSPPRGDTRLRIGFLVPSLSTRAARALAGQMAHHDRTRFALFVYSQTPHASLRDPGPLEAVVDGVQEVSHMTDAELVARIRFDGLDLMLDMTSGTADARGVALAQRVARVQARPHASLQYQAGAPIDYVIGDRFVHEGSAVQAAALVRLPHATWLAPAPRASSEPAAEDHAVLLRTAAGAALLDADSLDTWFDVLVAVPAAVLDIGPAPRPFLDRVRHQARARGIDPQRLRVTEPGARLEDLYLDPMQASAPAEVARALAEARPVVSFCGRRPLARSGAAILQAAGLGDWAPQDRDTWRELIMSFARDAAARHAATARIRALQAARQAPWWNAPARAREIEWAWLQLIGRGRSAAPPQSFDVPEGATPPPAP